MTCHLGDFEEYAGLRRAISDREADLSRAGAANRRAEAASSLERLRPGDVIHVPAGRRGGLAVVLDPGQAVGADGPRPTVLTADRQVRRLSMVDFPTPVEPLQRLRIPKSFNARNPAQRRDLASTLRNTGLAERPPRRPRKGRSAAADDRELAQLRRQLRTHPCHGCPEREDHARWAERYHRLARETEALQRRMRHRTNTISLTFDRICTLLEELGYLEGDTVTAHGRRLAVIYNELDLLTAECLRDGVWNGLEPAELAACVSALVFESRQPEDAAAPRLPAGASRSVLAEMVRMWGALEEREHDHRLDGPREPDLGFAWATWHWASGHSLDFVLRDSDLQAGDFVRWTKQVIDLLGQVADAARVDTAGADLAAVGRNAARAADLLRRGVVAYSGVA
jgi:ATP-dependent RNA helicase HelY